jgi:hypothetical protein
MMINEPTKDLTRDIFYYIMCEYKKGKNHDN